MSKFIFDDSLKLGIAQIDHQHGRFIGYINDTWDALERGDDSQEFLYILNQLLDYAVEHFSCEEALMREHGYPDYAAHKARHNTTAAELFDFDLRLLADDPAESRAFITFLTDWLRNHIQVVDVELAAFLKEKGVN